MRGYIQSPKTPPCNKFAIKSILRILCQCNLSFKFSLSQSPAVAELLFFALSKIYCGAYPGNTGGFSGAKKDFHYHVAFQVQPFMFPFHFNFLPRLTPQITLAGSKNELNLFCFLILFFSEWSKVEDNIIDGDCCI